MSTGPPSVYAVCGLPGSGKTTFARQLAEDHPAILFSADEWMLGLYGPQLPVSEFAVHRERIWEHIWQLASQMLAMNVSVVLDFSFYKRSDRDDFRQRARLQGARFRLYHLDCDREVARGRIANRRRERPAHTFDLSGHDFDRLCEEFEPPGGDEEDIVHVEASDDLATDVT